MTAATGTTSGAMTGSKANLTRANAKGDDHGRHRERGDDKGGNASDTVANANPVMITAAITSAVMSAAAMPCYPWRA
jgi:hypothetical protein